MASEIDEKLKDLKEKADGIWPYSETVNSDVYRDDVTWLLNYVDMLRADLSRAREGADGEPD